MKEITERFDLGMGLWAEVVYTDVGPDDAPNTGAEWPREIDLPQVSAKLRLPKCGLNAGTDTLTMLHPALRCSAIRIFGAALGEWWGVEEVTEDMYRHRVQRIQAERVADAYRQARGTVEDAIKILRQVVGTRVARLAGRDATIALSRIGSPFSGGTGPCDEGA